MSESSNDSFMQVRDWLTTSAARSPDNILYLKALGRNYISSFKTQGWPENLTPLDDMQIVSVQYGSGPFDYAYHSVVQPARITTEFKHYFLFDYLLTQGEWFSILDYSEEEQLVHVLKWGRA